MPTNSLMQNTFVEKLKRLNLAYIAVVCILASIGVLLLYSAAHGSWTPYAERHLVRFVMGLGMALVIAFLPLRLIFKMSYLIYFLAIVLLILVQVMGVSAGGATRWLDVGFMRIQPSEIAKIAIVLAAARFYHQRQIDTIKSFSAVVFVAVGILIPVGLTIIQPDLGTSLFLMMVGAGVMFFAGVPWGYFAGAFAAGLALIPVAWNFFLHDYQKGRVLTFLDPSRDPLGAGYHIIQSKIAIGSAGFWGKGFMQGSQSQLQFLPEKHTDFIFTLLTEDFGAAGALIVISLYLTLILMGVYMSIRNLNQYCSLVIAGVTTTLFVYAFINMAMVMGLMPVVGLPLPFLSYGGTSLLTLMVSLGLVLNMDLNRYYHLPGASGLSSGRYF